MDLFWSLDKSIFGGYMTQQQTVAIVDYGMGNVGSIRNMLRKVGARPVVASSPEALDGAEKIVLPGVGSFDQGMEKLKASGFSDALEHLVIQNGVPILGICLGMQLFTRASEEGNLPGLGWLNARTVRFQRDRIPAALRIPHMGWNTVFARKSSPLLDGLSDEQRFYFLHSYHVVCETDADILTETEYGYPFVSAFSRGNILGAQFHPEKSHNFGMTFFRRFVEAF